MLLKLKNAWIFRYIFRSQIENYFFSLDINLSIPLSKPIDKLDDSGISDISRGGQYIRYLHARSTFVYFYYFILYTFKHLGNVCSIPHMSQRQTVTMIPATLSPLVTSLPRRVVTFIWLFSDYISVTYKLQRVSLLSRHDTVARQRCRGRA